MSNKQITIFFSWQADSPYKTNRNFIEECIKSSTKEITKEIPIIFNIDRDTKNVGGMPGVVDTVLKKIRACDIFIWDATIVYKDPKYAPNPNVLIELGYAFAVLGEGRIIGIINESNGTNADELPFDLMHRRWPIKYNLSLKDTEDVNYKKEQKKILTNNLRVAIKTSLNEPKNGLIQSDIDFHISKNLWEIINSDWMLNWLYYRRHNIQYEQNKFLKVLEMYKYYSLKPENQFVEERLRLAHSVFLKSIDEYLLTFANEMEPKRGHDDMFVISVKNLGWVENYDQLYEKQVDRLLNALTQVENSWREYVNELRLIYPEITHKY